MSRLRVALIAVCLLPSLSSAQRRGGMGGAKEADWDAVASKRGVGGPSIAPKDFEGASLFRLLADKKKDLKLTDEQLAMFRVSDERLKASNAGRFTLLDSLRKDARPRTSGDPSAEDETRMVLAREALYGVARDIRSSYDSAAKATVPTLDPSQQAMAQTLLKKYDDEMQEMLGKKLGGRGAGMPDGGRRPPGR